MTARHRHALAAALVATLAGCAAGPPRLVQPPELARAAEAYPIRGLRDRDAGYFALAGHVGSFARGPAALTAAGFTDLRPGSVAFDIAGPELPGAVEAICDAEAETAEPTGSDGAAPARAMLHCEFLLDGGPTDWRLTLDDDPDAPGRRRGMIALDGAILALRSGDTTGPGEIGPIIGYVIDGAQGALASLDLGVEPPVLLLATTATPQQRSAAIVAAAGLSALAGSNRAGG